MTAKKSKSYRPKPIKPFKTLEEEAHFWDTHSVAPLFDNPKVLLSELPLIEKEKEAVLIIRIQQSVKEQIKRIAQKKGINTATLSRMWLIEKLAKTR